MVKIKRGKKELTVSEGAYKNFYERKDWRLVGNDSQIDDSRGQDRHEEAYTEENGNSPDGSNDSEQDDPSGEGEDEDNTEGKDDSLSDEELLEIPVAEMTPEQLKRAAKLIGYDYKADGIKKAKPLREAMAKKLAAR